MRVESTHLALLAACLYTSASQAANSTGVGAYVAQGLGQASSTTSSSIIASTTASSAPSCPGANNTQITDRYGVKYAIYCDMYLPADNDTVPRTYTTKSDYSECAPQCDQINGCRGFTWLDDEDGTGTCSFCMNHGLPIPNLADGGVTSTVSGRRVNNGTGSGTLGASSTTSRSRSSSTSTITACAAYQTALPNNTLGWYTTGPNLTFSGAVATWTCLPENVPCNLICGDDETGCISSGSSVAATCSPQWSAYSCSYSSYVSKYITGSFTTTYGDIFTSTIMEYPTTVTASTSFTFYAWGGNTSIITPVYVFGTPTAVSTVTSTADDYAVHTVASSDGIYWSSTTDVEATYGTTYTTEYLELYDYPLTDFYPVPTPACTITEVYSASCDTGGTAAGEFCNIYGGTVEVYYWPGVTPGPDGKFANTTKPVNPSTTEVDGITMTSPSVYVSFGSVYASDSCRQIGAMHTGSVLAFDPASISTVYGGPGFMSDDIPDGASVYNFGDLGPTLNAAAYERQVQCVVETGCPTIYPTYAPTISVPSELRSMDPAWASCYPDFRGFYDPPKALQQQQTEAGVGGYSASATPSPTISSPLAVNTGSATTKITSVEGPSQYSAVPSPVVKTSETDLKPSGVTSLLDNPGTSQTAGSDTEPSPEVKTSESEASPDGYTSVLDNSGTSQTAGGDPGNAQTTTNVGGLIGALLGGGSVQSATQTGGSDPDQSTTGVGSEPGLTSEDPGRPESAATPVLTVGGSTVTPDPSGNYVIGSSTLAPGSPAVVLGGSTYSLDPSGSNVVINGQTQQLAPSQVAAGNNAAGIALPGTTLTPDASGQYIVGSSTLAPGSSAVVFGGTTYSLDPSGSNLVVDGITQTLQSGAQPTGAQGVYTANGQTYTEDPSSNVVVAGETISPGSQTVLDGTTYSLASSGSALVVNGITQTLQSGARPTGAQGIYTADGHTYTEGPSSQIVVAGQTVSLGSQTVIEGTTYSLVASGSDLVVNGVTQTLQPGSTNEPVLTVGSNTYTEDQNVSGFIIGSETLTEGGTVTVGLGTAAQTLRLTTASDGETEVMFGTTSTQVIGAASQTSSAVHLPSLTTAKPESSTSVSGAASKSSSTTSAATSNGILHAATVALTALVAHAVWL